MSTQSNELREELKKLALEYEILSESGSSGLSLFFDDLLALIQERERLARLDELNHIAVDDNEATVCYFEEESHCNNDLSIPERIKQLAQLQGEPHE